MVPSEGWTVKALGVVFNIHNQLGEGPLQLLHFQNVEETIRAMRDFYHRKGVPYGVDVDVSYGSLLIGVATLRMGDDLSMAGETSVQVSKRVLCS